MTVDELYNFILTKMTAEQALRKFIEGGLITYEKLKFDDQGKAIHPILVIAMAAADMGWGILVDVDAPTVEGLVVGSREYVEKTVKPPPDTSVDEIEL